ncbi:MAG: hypothetical protein C7B46_20840 [Sulfobacillus benefaciens]|uniref:Uncharacterized protein n=1 Tax=Sulfobacillus benefaciens TaxID=453960 RepID=A0A2T2WRV7_9FIRM|nr:MAG: hypothetical protein C7B46_20840 [Sulfobacillus benefaciens]
MVESIQCVSLIPERWPDLVSLFGPGGAEDGCWCMWHRETNQEFVAGSRRAGAANHDAFEALVHGAVVPHMR